MATEKLCFRTKSRSGHTFDPTPGVASVMAERTQAYGVKYHGIGIGDRKKTEQMDGIPVEIDSLHGIMKELNHTNVDIVKIDVEGAEFDAFAPLFANNCELFPPIDQILVEVHLWLGIERVLNFLPQMEECGYRVFAVEPNMVLPHLCCEFAFIRFDL